MTIATGNYAKLDFGRFEKCPVCQDYGYFGGNFSQHRCKPAFYCKIDHPHHEDNWKIFADDCEDAAKKFICKYDGADGDYSIAYHGEEIQVVVISAKDYDRIPEAEDEIESLQNHLSDLRALADDDLDEADREHLISLPNDIAALKKEISELKTSFKTFKVTGEIVPSYSAEEVQP